MANFDLLNDFDLWVNTEGEVVVGLTKNASATPVEEEEEEAATPIMAGSATGPSAVTHPSDAQMQLSGWDESIILAELSNSPELGEDPRTHVDCPAEIMPVIVSGSSQPITQQSEAQPAAAYELSEEEINAFIHEQRPKNTVNKTTCDVKKFEAFLSKRGDNRKVCNIPPNELNRLLRPFFLAMRKKDRSEYEPSTIDSVFRSLDRHLRDTQYPCSLINDHAFQSTRALITAKKKQLVEVHGKGQRPNAATALSYEEENKLWEEGKLGTDTPQTLLNTVWFYNNFFGFRARDEHHKLRLGDIVLGEDETGRFLELVTDRGSKNRPAAEVGSGNPKKVKNIKPRLWENTENPSHCPVAAHALYVSKRPEAMKDPNSNFYLTPMPAQYFDPLAPVWFKKSNLGVKSLGTIMTNMCKGTLEGRFSNHSGRKTTIQRLKDAKVPDTDIIQLTGHSNPASLKPYDKVNKGRLHDMSKILCSNPSPSVTPPVSSTVLSTVSGNQLMQPDSHNQLLSTLPQSSSSNNLFTSNVQNNSHEHRSPSLDGIFAGTTITGGVFNISLFMPSNRATTSTTNNTC